ncbi:MAG: hypothetical protein FWD06_10170, partial [Oscillospiraceae bacterium]|nr:hypothetical protein [Oscillospiraceae bacterium]
MHNQNSACEISWVFFAVILKFANCSYKRLDLLTGGGGVKNILTFFRGGMLLGKKIVGDFGGSAYVCGCTWDDV